MVGWVRSRPPVKSQTQMGASAFHNEATMVRRVGSASAFISSALSSAQLSLTTGRAQHTPRSRITGSSLIATKSMLQYPSTNIDGFRSKHMSDIKEAVRSRYAGAARKIEVLPLDSTPACCQVDGPDCGCAGAYSVDELNEIGLSDGVSLGCGNPTMLASLAPRHVVLDLGSGAGLDVLLSARRVAPGGHAYGGAMTDEMLALANENKAPAGVANATFLKGAIEAGSPPPPPR